MLTTDVILDGLREAFRNNETKTPLASALARLKEPILVGEGDEWHYEGFISLFHAIRQAVRAVDPSVPAGFPAHCLDPEMISRFFRIPSGKLAGASPPPTSIESSLTGNHPQAHSSLSLPENIPHQGDHPDYLTLTDASKLIPGRRGGKRISTQTVWRWCMRADRNGTRLKSVLIGGQRYTTRRWLNEFIEAKSASAGPSEITPAPIRTPGKRQTASELAAEELKATWARRGQPAKDVGGPGIS